MASREISVTFKSGGQQIVGMLHWPAGKSSAKCPGVVFFHGFTGNKAEVHRIFLLTARRLAKAGIASLRFDFRGSGDSEGDFSEMTVTRELEDARVAMAFLRKHPRIDKNRIGIIGMSMGGMVSALLLGEDPGIRAATLWCPVGNFRRLVKSKMTSEVKSQIDESGIADYLGWPVSRAFAFDGMRHRPVRSMRKTRADVLILHGDADDAVPADDSKPYEIALRKAKREVRRDIIKGADHCFSSLPWTESVISRTFDWMVGHLMDKPRNPVVTFSGDGAKKRRKKFITFPFAARAVKRR